VRYLTLAEALVVAESVTGVDAAVLGKMPGIGLLDSALQAPQSEFGGQEFYPDVIDKAAVLAVRIARNHSLPDGNKRLSWTCLVLFCELNGLELACTADDAVEQMLRVASGAVEEGAMASWLASRVQPVETE
jgi:death on curing protein